MDMQKLKSAAESIELSADAGKRITENCLAQFSQEQEVSPMKKHMKRSLLIAAVLVLCLPVIGMAVSRSCYFNDVKNIFGTVTGTEYKNATDEILLSASVENKTLRIETTFTAPDSFPYKTSEQFAVGAYQILNEADKVVLEGESPSVTITEGQAVFCFSLDALENGNYTLRIDSFISSKKADQPLPVYGSWCIDFTL